MKNDKMNKMVLLVMLLQALPIPLSLITIIGSVISIANISIIIDQSVFVAVIAIIFMVLSGTYALSYILSVVKTVINKKISFISFLPLIHLAMTIIFCVLWILTEKQFIN